MTKQQHEPVSLGELLAGVIAAYRDQRPKQCARRLIEILMIIESLESTNAILISALNEVLGWVNIPMQASDAAGLRRKIEYAIAKAESLHKYTDANCT